MGSTDQGRRYKCLTQESSEPVWWQPPLPEGHSDTPSIVVGVGPIVPRWDVSQANTTLKFFVRADTFSSVDDANHAAQAFQQAADEWNSLSLGIRISKSATKGNANFDLVYAVNNGPSEAGRYAEAFFPHQADADVIVTEFALSAKEKNILKNVFLHEIGHILGLRHEFAIAKEGMGAVQFMQRNPKSVMSYSPIPTLQQSDKDGVREFYRLGNGVKVVGSPITDFKPVLRTS